MTKADVLAKLEEYKDRPVVIGVPDEGIVLYGNIEGHWLFTKGDNLIEVKTNIAGGQYGIPVTNPAQNPFVVTTVKIDEVLYVKGFISSKPGKVEEALTGLTVVGSSKSYNEVLKEILTDSILKETSARPSIEVQEAAVGTSYGEFRGSAISLTKEGLPKFYDKLLEKNE